MATKDTSFGLLARVANLVRSPVPEAAPVAEPNVADGGDSGKMAIKRMIERKAHNDAVRKREFNQLRKLRQVSSAEATKMVARTSFFQDSSGYSVLEERASTLKKIDEIEAQMSKQWWKNRQGTASPAGSPNTIAGTEKLPGTPESQLPTCNTFAATLTTNIDDIGSRLSVTQVPPVDRRASPRPAVVPPAPLPTGTFDTTGNSAFSVSKMVTIDMGQALSDPTLEDAAIRFANGDDAGAELVLLDALRGGGASDEPFHAWAAALFDLYRGTGQRASFERFALDFAQRFDRSAPGWFSTPEALAANPVPNADRPQSRADLGMSGIWLCPAELDARAVAQLCAMVASGYSPCRMDWRLLKTITPDAGQALAQAFSVWCASALVFQLEGVELLGEALRMRSPMGDRQVAQFWWRLRMELLRMLGSQDEFELVAMDFCITYEVSPMPWLAAQCQRTFGQFADTSPLGAGNQGVVVEADAQAGEMALPGVHRIELAGEVLGTGSEQMQPLRVALQEGGALQVNCERLIRVDFSAAGSILNWVAVAKTAGKQIELRQVPCLVAAFFNLIGINEHARVTARVN